MSPVDARVLVWCAELSRDFAEVERHHARAASANPAASEHAAAFVALELDHAYQAFESFLLRLECGLGLGARTGASWHRALLEDAALNVVGLRPAVAPAAASTDWASVMAFRHFLRRAYSTELSVERLLTTRAALERAVVATAPVVAATIERLREASSN